MAEGNKFLYTISTLAVVLIMIGITASVGLKAMADYRTTASTVSSVTNESIDAVTEDRVYKLNFSATPGAIATNRGTSCIRTATDYVRNGTVGNGSTCSSTGDGAQECNLTVHRSNYTINYNTGEFTLTDPFWAGDRLNISFDYYDVVGCSLIDSEEAITNQTDYLGLLATLAVIGIIVAILVVIFMRRSW